MRTFIDRGGTFTDIVLVDDAGRARVRKVRSDEAIVGELAEGELVFGTTVATNALLERKVVPTALMVTRGFRDLVSIGDMSRPELFDPDQDWPEPLCEAVVEVAGRIDSEGQVVQRLELPEVSGDFRAVAIVLVNSHRNPEHELALAAAVREAMGAGVFISLGHQVDPELGYLSRIHTTLVDAALTPVLQAALERDRIPESAQAMRSNGSVCPAAELRAPDAILSGPAGGVLAVAEVARRAGFASAVGLDMGGTSTDVCRVDVGTLPRVEGEVRVAGVRLRRPMLEVETIAAGGGSVLGFDGLRMTVGPESAGADPGPACYGRGGPPTLTDAALALGLVDPGAFSPPLEPHPLPGEAAAFVAIAREKMAQAVKRIATARGIDVSGHCLVSYGGAAGAHAAAVAERLGVGTVLVHPCASLLSAWGQSLARRQESLVEALWTRDFRRVEESWETPIDAEGERLCSVEVRVRGTDHTLEVGKGTRAEVDEAFRREHLHRYGYEPEGELEYVNAWIRVLGRAPRPPVTDQDPWGIGERVVEGPEVLFSPTTAIQVPVGWTARIRDGLLRIEHRSAPQGTKLGSSVRSPLGLELWGNRFMAVAEQAGEVLRRTARSVNIRERLDFSCAVFDAGGHLVANAPHIPVHLGAMGETVRDLIATGGALQGNHWLCNDPAAGGSHLPDLTVVTPAGPFFVASRGHHVDVGGLTPGSMPPHSTTLAEEGELFRHVPLLVDGQYRPPEIGRQPNLVRADLAAQIAANTHAARALLALGAPELLAHWMGHLQDLADESLRLDLRGGATGRVGGSEVSVHVESSEGRLRVVFGSDDGPCAGNRNAPRAVVRAALLYVLRCLCGSGLPLNEGVLRRVDLVLPPQSVLDPPPGAAVVGGNVETSQQLVDLLFYALGERAGSQGTMNNLTIGGEGWSFYETIGGGGGASPGAAGLHGRQLHMTNTRATDVEVLEARLPLRLRELSYRQGSGGVGEHAGGMGLLRELELLAPGRASLLASGYASGGRGLNAGQGQARRDWLFTGGQWVPWDGGSADLAVGDRIRIETPGGGACTPADWMS